jgi:uncharacterized protein YrrD
MNLKQHASVVTADRQEVGKIRRLVIEPHTKEVTHIVVRKDQFLRFPEDKVVPVNLIESVTEGQVTLRKETPEFAALPHYEEKIDWENGGADLGTRMTTSVPESRLNIPDKTVVVSEGTRVMSADDQRVGTMEEVQTESKADRAIHFVVSDGFWNKNRKLVPAAWVGTIIDDEIRLTVDAQTIHDLINLKV